MASQISTRLLLIIGFFSFHVILFPSLSAAAAAPSVPALYMFGDSSVDVGTNDFLPLSKAKANFQPYGIDLVPSKPTGRFSNGFNTADFVAKTMGFDRSPPPFLSLTYYSEARTGVNFASGGSGILETTGKPSLQIVSLGNQLRQFKTIQSNLTSKIGTAATHEHLSKSIFLISAGSNDLLEAYAAHGPLNPTQKAALVATLALIYKHHITTLYKIGARKFGVVGVPPIGCCPSQRILNPSGGCLENLNQVALEFFYATDVLLKDLSSKLPGMKYALGNTYEMVINFFNNAGALGFTEVKAACCGAGKLNGKVSCNPSTKFCPNRDQYLFWDLFHPTQAASKIAAQTLFSGSTKFIAPINLAQLAAA